MKITISCMYNLNFKEGHKMWVSYFFRILEETNSTKSHVYICLACKKLFNEAQTTCKNAHTVAKVSNIVYMINVTCRKIANA